MLGMNKKEKNMSFKFGDKVQIVNMDLSQYQDNLCDDYGSNELHYEDEADMGDVGVVITEPSGKTDWPEVAFKSGSYSCVIEVNPKDLMLHSEESEVAFLNNLLTLQEKCPYKKYETLEQSIRYEKNSIEVGCQDISKEDAIKIAHDILNHFKVA